MSAFSKEWDLPYASLKSKYLILSNPRTGSSMISSALRNSGVAGVPIEYFGPHNLKYLPQPITLRALSDYYSNVIPRRTSSNGVFGMKIHFSHFKRFFVLNGAVTKNGIGSLKSFDKTILLSRTDKVAQVVSLLIAERSQRYNSESKDDEASKSLVYRRDDTLNILKGLVEAVADDMAWQAISKSLNLNPLTVTYENLMNSQENELGRIAEYLELPVSTLTPKTVKLSRDGHQEAKQRFLDEIGASLRMI